MSPPRPPRNTAPAGPNSALAERIHRSAIQLLRQLRSVDRELSLGPARLSALSVLVFGGPSTLGALAHAEQVRPATMTRIVQALERDGLARRRADADDARRVWIEPTAAGRRLLEQGRRRRLEALEARLATLTRDELAALERGSEVFARIAHAGAHAKSSRR